MPRVIVAADRSAWLAAAAREGLVAGNDRTALVERADVAGVRVIWWVVRGADAFGVSRAWAIARVVAYGADAREAIEADTVEEAIRLAVGEALSADAARGVCR